MYTMKIISNGQEFFGHKPRFLQRQLWLRAAWQVHLTIMRVNLWGKSLFASWDSTFISDVPKFKAIDYLNSYT